MHTACQTNTSLEPMVNQVISVTPKSGAHIVSIPENDIKMLESHNAGSYHLTPNLATIH